MRLVTERFVGLKTKTKSSEMLKSSIEVRGTAEKSENTLWVLHCNPFMKSFDLILKKNLLGEL